MLRQVTVVMPGEDDEGAMDNGGPHGVHNPYQNPPEAEEASDNPAAQAYSSKQERIRNKRQHTGAPQLEKKSRETEEATRNGPSYLDGDGRKKAERRRKPPAQSAYLDHLNAEDLDDVFKPEETRLEDDWANATIFPKDSADNIEPARIIEETGSFSDKFDRFEDSNFDIHDQNAGKNDKDSNVDINLSNKSRRRGDKT